MFKRTLFNCLGALSLCCLVACGYTGAEVNTETLELTKLDNGNLQYCDDTGDCYELNYAGDCAVVEIIIDTISGQTCERCLMADGTVIDNGCENAIVECVLVTVPDPDCVVCAYVDGAVIYSSCQVDEPQCYHNADCSSDNGLWGTCIDGDCHYEPRCLDDADCGPGFWCAPSVCPMASCTPDWCPPCYGTCEPAGLTCDTVLCIQGYHCEMQDVVCVTWPCPPQPVCVPNDVACTTDADCLNGQVCEQLVCPAMPCFEGEPCPPCQGRCVDPNPSDCLDDSECGPGEICLVACYSCPAGDPCWPECFGECVPGNPGCQDNSDCRPDEECMYYCWDCAAGAIDCVGGCEGYCEPVYQGCSDDYDCAPGEQCIVLCWACDSNDPSCVGGCEGYCEPVNPGCTDDSQCGPDEQCITYCWDCAAGDPTCVSGCEGYCEPLPPPSCQSDADCATDEQCVIWCYDYYCPATDPSCVGGCEGYCEPVFPDPCDDVICRDGEHCEVYEVNCFTTPCPPQPTCVPDPDPGCLSDADCGAGEYCEPGLCPPMPCSPDWCPVCNGTCMPLQPPSCQTDADCGSNEQCTVWCYDYCLASDPTFPNCCQGVCEPVITDPCALVDCAPGYHCEAQEVVCITWPCPDLAVCVPDTVPNDCFATGCSGQICSDQDVMTTCEYLPEYACFANATCERQADGACGWTETADLLLCLGTAGSGSSGGGTP